MPTTVLPYQRLNALTPWHHHGHPSLGREIAPNLGNKRLDLPTITITVNLVTVLVILDTIKLIHIIARERTRAIVIVVVFAVLAVHDLIGRKVHRPRHVVGRDVARGRRVGIRVNVAHLQIFPVQLLSKHDPVCGRCDAALGADDIHHELDVDSFCGIRGLSGGRGGGWRWRRCR